MIAALELTDAELLVVGGGRVATRRLERLLAAGARITVVAPTGSERLAAWAATGRVRWWRRVWRPQDLDGGWRLVVVAVDDPELDRRIVRMARARGLWCNSALGGGDVRFLAERRVGPVALAVDTEGRAPGVAARMADHLAAALTERWPPELLARWEREGWPRGDEEAG